MLEERTYQIDKALILNTIWDMAELQHGSRTLDDAAGGRLGFATEMYGIRHEYRFTVRAHEGGCVVGIETEGGARVLFRAFALLESMLGAGPANEQPG